MQNLDQIRAAKALEAVTREGSLITKQTVSKLPAMIIANGLLAAAAFAGEQTNERKSKRPAMQAALNQVAEHLADPIHGITVLMGCNSAQGLIDKLALDQASSLDLQRATTEALAFLGYLKRFAVKEGDDE